MRIVSAREEDSGRWDRFVSENDACLNYHRWGWKRVIEKSFRWPTFYLLAEEDQAVRGILPIVWQKSRLFGSFLTSLPFLSGGGIVGDSAIAREALVAEAVSLAKRLRVGHLELRHRRDPQVALPTKTHKVAMLLPLEKDPEKMWEAIPYRIQRGIRKGIKADLTADFGGSELLDDFYHVFARNMRELGTPVFSRVFFAQMLEAFPRDNFICVVRDRGKPIAASFLLGYRNAFEAGWSCSLYDYLAVRPNHFLYWKILCSGPERGYTEFDFGRSTMDSGTHEFKKQWAARELPLVWAYWVPNGNELPEVNKENPRYQMAIKLWQKLPLPVTKMVGPPLVRCLP